MTKKMTKSETFHYVGAIQVNQITSKNVNIEAVRIHWLHGIVKNRLNQDMCTVRYSWRMTTHIQYLLLYFG